MVSQISVFIENRGGRILKLAEVLRSHGVDILALSVADTKDFGLLRLIVRDTEKAVEVLNGAGFATTRSELIGAEVEDCPGGLCDLLTVLDAAGFSLEYVYSYVRGQNQRAVIFFKVSEPERAIALLEKKGITLLSQETL